MLRFMQLVLTGMVFGAAIGMMIVAVIQSSIVAFFVGVMLFVAAVLAMKLDLLADRLDLRR